MLTRCPNCDTAFRVTPAQIKARAGTVRCGECHFVFNALDTLEDAVPARHDSAKASYAEPLGSAAHEIGPFDETPAIAERPTLEWDDEPAESTFIPPHEPVFVSEPVSASEPMTALAHETQEAVAPLVTPTAPAYDYLAAPLPDAAAPPEKQWPWIAGSAAAIVVLLLQLAYYYRIEIAAMRPEWRPALVSLCVPLRCDVPRPRQIDAISIDSSDLRPDAQIPGRLQLAATLRSKSALAQEWPTLELTLTDISDRRLAVRQFAATDYLPKDRNRPALISAGFPPNGEIPVTLALDIDGLHAAGYRLYVFYP